MRGNVRETSFQFPPLEFSGPPTSPPTPSLVDPSGGGGVHQTLLGRMSQGRRLEEESEARRRQPPGQKRERTPAKVKRRRCREGMKERWAALGRPDTGNRPGRR